MAPEARPRPVGRDDAGQMMILAAIVLLIGFIALAGMVARVNQLGSQTATESRQAILDEVGPLTDAIEAGIHDLRGGRTIATGKTTSGSAILESTAAAFVPEDVGRHVVATGSPESIPKRTVITGYLSSTRVTLAAAANVTHASGLTVHIGLLPSAATTASSTTLASSLPFFVATDVGRAVTGPGIPPGTTLVAVASSTSATLSQPATATGSGVQLSIGRFALSATSTPTLDTAVAGLLEQLRLLEARHGFLMDWSCAANGPVKVTLSDGTVWLEIQPSTTYRCTTAHP